MVRVRTAAVLPAPSARSRAWVALPALVAALAGAPTAAEAQAGPPPVAGEAPPDDVLNPAADAAAPREIKRIVIEAPSAAPSAPALSCPPARPDPGADLACYERAHHATSPTELRELALRLERAGLFDEAGHRWRALSTRGKGQEGLEAGRRANALAELGLAMDVASRGKARRAKARLRSALQTLVRQRKDRGWAVPQAVALAAARVATAARMRREARSWLKLARRAGGGWATARANAPTGGRRSPSVLVERCLGGPGGDHVRHMVAHGEGWLAVGDATGPDGDTQLRTWVLDATGRTRRRADFGAQGVDRGHAVAVDPAGGGWAVGETAGQGGSDVLVVRLDREGRVRGHVDRDGGGVDRAVAVASAGGDVAWALAEANTAADADLWLLKLNRAGKIVSDTRERRPGHQRAAALLRTRRALWVLGSSDASGLAERYTLAGQRQGGVKGALPGPVLAAAEGRRALWLLGRRPDGRGWLAKLDRRGRVRAAKRFKPRLASDARALLLPQRRGLRLVVTGAATLGPAWTATLDRRGKLRGRTALTADAMTGVAGATRSGKKRWWVYGAAKGCGRGTRDGFVAQY